jgi:arsenite-transporting ATPase
MSLKEALSNLNIIMFGGKGGVGKTTCAASSAIWAAEHGRNTLIISTDPAHSLGDSLGLDLIPGEPVKVPGIINLTALEIDPKASMQEFSNLMNVNPMNEEGLGGLLGSLNVMEDLGDISSLSPPGIDETLALLKLLEFIETDHNYNLIIFDTAPTGHTLRFLSLPETLSGWIGKLLKLRIRLGKLFGIFKKMFSSDDSEDDRSAEILEKLNQSIIHAREDLTDPYKCSFVIVMIPENMAITETGRLINQLIKYNIPNSTVIVNQLYKDEENLCEFCQARRSMQKRNLDKINELFQDKMGKSIIELPLFKNEIREYEKLKELHQYLFT